MKDDGGQGGGNASSCKVDADCGANKICGFAAKDACTATGTCFDAPDAVCMSYSPGCACDGSEINVACTGLPGGYASKPLAHAGSCDSVAQDAGGFPPSCASDADCGGMANGFVCGFPTNEACNATGTCFDVRGMATCAAYSPGCACDGTETNIACLPVPQGYALKPLAHAGACNDAGK